MTTWCTPRDACSVHALPAAHYVLMEQNNG